MEWHVPLLRKLSPLHSASLSSNSVPESWLAPRQSRGFTLHVKACWQCRSLSEGCQDTGIPGTSPRRVTKVWLRSTPCPHPEWVSLSLEQVLGPKTRTSCNSRSLFHEIIRILGRLDRDFEIHWIDKCQISGGKYVSGLRIDLSSMELEIRWRRDHC